MRALVNALLDLQGADEIVELILLNPISETSRPVTATAGSITWKSSCAPAQATT